MLWERQFALFSSCLAATRIARRALLQRRGSRVDERVGIGVAEELRCEMCVGGANVVGEGSLARRMSSRYRSLNILAEFFADHRALGFRQAHTPATPLYLVWPVCIDWTKPPHHPLSAYRIPCTEPHKSSCSRCIHFHVHSEHGAIPDYSRGSRILHMVLKRTIRLLRSDVRRWRWTATSRATECEE